MDKVIVYGHGKPWEFGGKSGVSIYTGDALPLTYDGMVGYLPIADTYPLLALGDLKEVPGIYEVQKATVPTKGKDGKMFQKSVIVSFKFVERISFEPKKVG